MKIITDLACELLRRRPATTPGLTVTIAKKFKIMTQTTTITNYTAAKKIGKPIGTYINIDTSASDNNNHISNLIAQNLRTLIHNFNKILIIGLGNQQFIADSLGPQVLKQINTTTNLATFEPNVCGVTGINSVDAIKAITNLVTPDVVIVIDSLVSATPERIGTNYQICTSGITPGSGIGRNNQTIDQKLLGVPVLAIGIPVCTIMTVNKQIYHVVPKNIDCIIENCAAIIAAAINTLARHNSCDGSSLSQ